MTLDLAGHALDAAPRLLGWRLRQGDRVGVIVEVEAYGGDDDPASHAFRGPTRRNAVMFGAPGRLYVYLIYGMYRCANVVCGPVGTPGAVLIRALAPVDGLDAMGLDRPSAQRVTDYCSGPGKLTAALGVGLDHDGVDLLAPTSPVRLEPPTPQWATRLASPTAIVSGPRVGITRAVDLPWRFAVLDDPNVSRPRPWPRTPRPGRAAT
jgi:DNA-3-methyladenine glycosylase